MAMSEHCCVNCGNFVFNNFLRCFDKCEKCGGEKWLTTYDEDLGLDGMDDSEE